MSYWLRKVIEPRVAAWFGVAAPVCALTSIGLSILFSPWFSWTHNALSDLGISDAAPIFNSGLIVTGGLLSIFAISFAREERRSTLGFTGGSLLLLLGISVAGVGVFTEHALGMHIFFAFTTFASIILALILLGTHFVVKQETRTLGALALAAAGLSTIASLALNASVRLPGVAIYEALIGFPALPWFIALSVRLMRVSS